GAEMLQADGRHRPIAQLSAGEQPAMAGDDLQPGIDQDRYVEAEGGDAVGDLSDLFGLMPAGVARVGFELVNRPIDNLDPLVTLRQGRMMLHPECLSLVRRIRALGWSRKEQLSPENKTPAEAIGGRQRK